MTLNILDTRQFRTDQPCGPAPRANPPIPDDCEARLAADNDMLGPDQSAWLYESLTHSDTHWNVVASSVWFNSFRYDLEGVTKYNTDSWDGYPAARDRLLETIQDVDNVIFVSGDWHVNGASDLVWNNNPVASEFATTSISGVGPWAPIMKSMLPLNPHFRMVDGDDLRNGVDVHGYVLNVVTRNEWTAHYKVVDTIKVPDADIETKSTFVVKSGVAGILE